MSRAYAEGDVVSVSSVAAKTSASSQIALASDGTPIVHKSFHKKKTRFHGGCGDDDSGNQLACDRRLRCTGRNDFHVKNCADAEACGEPVSAGGRTAPTAPPTGLRRRIR